MMHDRERGAAASRRSHAVARKDLHVFRDHFCMIEVGLGPRSAGYQPVDLVLGNPRIIKCEPCRSHIKLGRAVLGHDSNLSISYPDNRDPISHVSSTWHEPPLRCRSSTSTTVTKLPRSDVCIKS